MYIKSMNFLQGPNIENTNLQSNESFINVNLLTQDNMISTKTVSLLHYPLLLATFQNLQM